MNAVRRLFFHILIMIVLVFAIPHTADAAGFDPGYYAQTYPDVVAVLGVDQNALYQHYVTYGMQEGRYPYAGATPGEVVEDIVATFVPAEQSVLPVLSVPAATPATVIPATAFHPVPIEKLANYMSLKRKMTDEEFQQAYTVALQIVTLYAELSKEEQLIGIAISLREICDNGLNYSTSNAHYNDPYGYLVLGTASCAGCARATGLCLNILGLPYEHVNENQWNHQWCRVYIDGTYWICDAFGLYCGPEPAPYTHPYLQ